MRDLPRSAACALFALASVTLLGATDGSVELPSPGSDAWEPVSFRSVERPTGYAPLPGDEAGTRADARCGASALVLRTGSIDLSRTPMLRWRWRVIRPLDVDDERRRGGDDFAARVYVMFRFERERASLLGRLRQALGERLFGADMPGSALAFVWASRVEPGSLWTNPYAAKSKMIALASGPDGGWRSEAVDLVAAYARAFGRPPPEAYGIGIMTDADDTCQHAVAEYKDFRLTAAEPDPAASGMPGRVKPPAQRARRE